MVRLPARARYVSLPQSIQTDSEAHPASSSMETRKFSLGLKRPERKSDNSFPSSATGETEYICAFILLHIFMVCTGLLFTKYYSGDQIKKNEMGEAGGT